MGMGPYNAHVAMGRAVELAEEHGMGVVAIRNTNHWQRGGAYGLQAADAGMLGICWTNTTGNMPPWGSAADNTAAEEARRVRRAADGLRRHRVQLFVQLRLLVRRWLFLQLPRR